MFSPLNFDRKNVTKNQSQVKLFGSNTTATEHTLKMGEDCEALDEDCEALGEDDSTNCSTYSVYFGV